MLTLAISLTAGAVAQTKGDTEEESYPITRTDLIVNPSFEENGAAGWTNVGLKPQSNSAFARKNGNVYMEKWIEVGNEVGSARITQVIKLPVGKYRLQVGAQNVIEGSTTRCKGAYIFAGAQQLVINTAREYRLTFTNICPEIEIGFVAENATGNWLAVDNFRLTQTDPLTDEEVKAELQNMIAQANEQLSSTMSATVRTQLETAIQTATALPDDATLEAIQQAAQSLVGAMVKATESIADFARLQKAIDEAEAIYDADQAGADPFRQAIDHAVGLHQDETTTVAQIDAEIKALETAVFAFRIANATGDAPTATTHTRFFIPAAHGVLVRAVFAGANITERGICWSTDPEPTVLDNRSTDYYSQKGMLFHVKGMNPSTVYYVRAYAVTKTYAVGYGDVLKVVTLPQGSCRGTWNYGAPTAEANERCNTAIQQTIDYLNEWTAIKGFLLQGNYGSGTPTADCSYGGWMRIGPNAAYQAIGTVLHETGHGVGVGTHWRWNNCTDTRESEGKYGKWLGSWANKTLRFLENTDDEATFMTGDAVHGWGTNASYDWFVNGADKDKHTPAQYIGGCALLYSLYVDGLCPTSGHPNGVPGYTFNFDENKKYYIRCESAERGLDDGFVTQRGVSAVGWTHFTSETLNDSAAWYVEYEPVQGYYRFRNAATDRYMTHAASARSVTVKRAAAPSSTENFQLMPGRVDAAIPVDGGTYTKPTYWMTWNSGSNQAFSLNAANVTSGYGSNSIVDFNYSTAAQTQHFLFISEDELDAIGLHPIATGIEEVKGEQQKVKNDGAVYDLTGRRVEHPAKGFYIIGGKKTYFR